MRNEYWLKRYRNVLLAIFIACSSDFNGSFAFYQMPDKDYLGFINPYLIGLHGCLDELYNLDDELNSQKFRKAISHSEKSEVMFELFVAKKDKILLRLARRDLMSSSAFTLSLGALMGGFGFLLYKSRDSVDPFIFRSFAVGLSSMLSPAFHFGYESYSTLVGMTRLQFSGLKGLYIPVRDSEKLFARNYHKLKKNPLLLSLVIEKLKLLSRSSIEGMNSYKNYIETANALPLIQRGTWFDINIFNDRFKHFPQNMKKKLLSLAKRQVFVHRSSENFQSFPVYFQGIPGSGKTFAANALAEATHVSLGQVVLDGATIEEIIGTPFDPMGGKSAPGRLLTAIASGAKDIKTGVSYSDNILFIDEFDRLLNADDPSSKSILSFMLKILDPNNRTFFSPYLGVSVELPKTIILAGNYEIRDAALKNRFEIIKFEGYDRKQLEKIAMSSIVPKYCDLYGFEKNCLMDKERDLLAQHIAGSSDHGLRDTEKFILSLVSEKAYTRFKDLISNPQDTSDN